MAGNDHRFWDVYARKRWAVGGVLSGDGSRLATTAPVRGWIEQQARDGMRSLLDLGCGDLEWIAACDAVAGGDLSYFGIDVVAPLIAHHQRVFPWFCGEVQDLEAVTRIDADVVLLKDVLFHLCNGAAGQILMAVNAGRWKRLLVSTHPGADNMARRGLSGGRMAPLDVEATGLIAGDPAAYLPRPGGCYAIYERA